MALTFIAFSLALFSGNTADLHVYNPSAHEILAQLGIEVSAPPSLTADGVVFNVHKNSSDVEIHKFISFTVCESSEDADIRLYKLLASMSAGTSETGSGIGNVYLLWSSKNTRGTFAFRRENVVVLFSYVGNTEKCKQLGRDIDAQILKSNIISPSRIVGGEAIYISTESIVEDEQEKLVLNSYVHDETATIKQTAIHKVPGFTSFKSEDGKLKLIKSAIKPDVSYQLHILLDSNQSVFLPIAFRAEQDKLVAFKDSIAIGKLTEMHRQSVEARVSQFPNFRKTEGQSKNREQ